MLTPSSPLPATASSAVELRRVSQLFGSFAALRDISLELPAGSSVMLLGPNGAGKSTLLRLLAGLTEPTYGSVLVFGQLPRALRGRIAYMSHSTMLYDDLTAPENLAYQLGLHEPELPAPERALRVASALEEVGLDPANPRRLSEYSQGMRQRTSLARALLTAPELLLLDEPFSNLDTASASAMLMRLERFVSRPGQHYPSRTLVFTTHQADLARPLARLTLTMEAGRLVAPPIAQTAADASTVDMPPRPALFGAELA